MIIESENKLIASVWKPLLVVVKLICMIFLKDIDKKELGKQPEWPFDNIFLRYIYLVALVNVFY